MISREEHKHLINEIVRIRDKRRIAQKDKNTQDIIALNQAIDDMEKIQNIIKFISDYDGAITISENMGIICGQKLIDELKQILN